MVNARVNKNLTNKVIEIQLVICKLQQKYALLECNINKKKDLQQTQEHERQTERLYIFMLTDRPALAELCNSNM